ncbi:hypothetical protein MXB_2906 [Myxobolus squamalis]|nr:hypothetical protein MXB_2906 [Myxobolus squamalis]
MALIMFTSGTTGTPKGVMISHKNIIAVTSGIKDIKPLTKYNIYAAFLPSAHIFEYYMEMALLAFGSTLGFCTPFTLLDKSPMIKAGTKGDLPILKPTVMIVVPYQQILYQTCYAIKIFYRKLGHETPIMDRLLSLVGHTFLAILKNLAGSPLNHCEIKLVPWEEGNCNPEDEKNPCGEIAVSGDCVAMGYYKEDELTAASFKIDPVTGKRWYMSGDIALVTPNGTMKIIDRKKDIIKLLHGEYVSLVMIESVIGKNDLVDMVCVLPTKSMAYLVALVIPNRERSKKYLLEQNIGNRDSEIQDLLENSTVTAIISQWIKISLKDSLNLHEVPNIFCILSDLWTPESNLITPTQKLKRFEISKKYSHLLL